MAGLYLGVLMKQLRGRKSEARKLERKARQYVQYLFEDMHAGQTFHSGTWTLTNGRRIKAFVWNDLMGRRATVRLLAPGVEISSEIRYKLHHGWLRQEYDDAIQPKLFLSSDLVAWLENQRSFFGVMVVKIIKAQYQCPRWESSIELEEYNEYEWPFSAGMADGWPPIYTGEAIRLVQALRGAGRDLTSVLYDPKQEAMVLPNAPSLLGAVRRPDTAQWWLYWCSSGSGLVMVPLKSGPEVECYASQIRNGDVVPRTMEWDMTAAALLSRTRNITQDQLIRVLEPGSSQVEAIFEGGGGSIHPFCGWHGFHQPNLDDLAGIVQVFTRSSHVYESKKVQLTFHWDEEGVPTAPSTSVGGWEEWGGPLYRVRVPVDGYIVGLLPPLDTVLDKEATIYCFTTLNGIRSVKMLPQKEGGVEGFNDGWGTICGTGEWTGRVGEITTAGEGGWEVPEAGVIHEMLAITGEDYTDLVAKITYVETKSASVATGASYWDDMEVSCEVCAGSPGGVRLGLHNGEWSVDSCIGFSSSTQIVRRDSEGVAVVTMLPSDSGVVIIDLQSLAAGTETSDYWQDDLRAASATYTNVYDKDLGEYVSGSSTFLHRYGNNCYCLVTGPTVGSHCRGYGYGDGNGAVVTPLERVEEGNCTIVLSTGEDYKLDAMEWKRLANTSIESVAEAPPAYCALHNSVHALSWQGPWYITGGVSSEVMNGRNIKGVGII